MSTQNLILSQSMVNTMQIKQKHCEIGLQKTIYSMLNTEKHFI